MRRRFRPISILVLLLFFLVFLALRMTYHATQYETDFPGYSGGSKPERHPVPAEDIGRHLGFKKNRTAPVLLRHYTSRYHLTIPIHGNYKCVNIKSDPPTPICIYDSLSDVFISHDLEDTGMWEPHVFSDFVDVLNRDPTLGVIDIGANIGVYSLVAAKMGHRVVAVEPLPESLYRLHKAAQLGHTADRIVALENAVADVRTSAEVLDNFENKGDTKIILGVHGCTGNCVSTVTTIYMDDILEVVNFTNAVIKIDVQGYEHRAFKHASKLLDSIHVEYIYMEWQEMRSYYPSANDYDVKTVEAMIQLLLNRDFRPHALDAHGAHALDARDWHKWPTDVVWRHLPTTKEKTFLLRNHFLNWPLN